MTEKDLRARAVQEKGLWAKRQDDQSVFALPPPSCAVLAHPFYSFRVFFF